MVVILLRLFGQGQKGYILFYMNIQSEINQQVIYSGDVLYYKHLDSAMTGISKANRYSFSEKHDRLFWSVCSEMLALADSMVAMANDIPPDEDVEQFLLELPHRISELEFLANSIPEKLVGSLSVFGRLNLSRRKTLENANSELQILAHTFSIATWTAADIFEQHYLKPDLPMQELLNMCASIESEFRLAYVKRFRQFNFTGIESTFGPTKRTLKIAENREGPSTDDIDNYLDSLDNANDLSLEELVIMVSVQFQLDTGDEETMRVVEGIVLHWGVPEDQKDWKKQT